MIRWIRSAAGAIALLACGVAAADTTTVKVNGTSFSRVPSGTEFVMRGVNYTKVSPAQSHTLLDLGTFNATAANAQLASMNHSGYNVVRIFIDPHGIKGTGPTSKLNAAYVSHLAQFINLAYANGLLVVATFSAAPWTYTASVPAESPASCNGSINHFATNAAMIAAKQAYVSDVIVAIRNAGARMSNIFSYGIENEFHYLKECSPISNTVPQYGCPNSGTSQKPIFRTTPAGTFDINTQCGQQQLQDANMVNYVNQVTAAIKGAHSAALVTMGFFSPVIADSNTLVRPYWAIVGSNLDYVSLHYNLSPAGVQRPPSLPWWSVWSNTSLDAQMNAMLESAAPTKPLVMEEFYMNKAVVSDITSAAYMARDAQIQACSWSGTRAIKNSLFWTWDTTDPDTGGYYWNLVEQSGAINGQLSPNVRPNPCAMP